MRQGGMRRCRAPQAAARTPRHNAVLVLGGRLLVDEIFDERKREEIFGGEGRGVSVAGCRAKHNTLLGGQPRDDVVGAFRVTDAYREMGLRLLL